MIDFKCTPDNAEPFEVTAGTRDILVWERTTKGASLKRLLDDMHLSDLYQVAYLAAKRTGKFTGTQTDFESTVDLVFETDEDADPTQPGA